MTIHTRLHIENPEYIDADGNCELCTAEPDGAPVGRLLDLDELLEQARNEIREPLRELLNELDDLLGLEPVALYNQAEADGLIEKLWAVAGR